MAHQSTDTILNGDLAVGASIYKYCKNNDSGCSTKRVAGPIVCSPPPRVARTVQLWSVLTSHDPYRKTKLLPIMGRSGKCQPRTPVVPVPVPGPVFTPHYCAWFLNITDWFLIQIEKQKRCREIKPIIYYFMGRRSMWLWLDHSRCVLDGAVCTLRMYHGTKTGIERHDRWVFTVNSLWTA